MCMCQWTDYQNEILTKKFLDPPPISVFNMEVILLRQSKISLYTSFTVDTPHTYIKKECNLRSLLRLTTGSPHTGRQDDGCGDVYLTWRQRWRGTLPKRSDSEVRRRKDPTYKPDSIPSRSQRTKDRGRSELVHLWVLKRRRSKGRFSSLVYREIRCYPSPTSWGYTVLKIFADTKEGLLGYLRWITKRNPETHR